MHQLQIFTLTPDPDLFFYHPDPLCYILHRTIDIEIIKVSEVAEIEINLLGKTAQEQVEAFLLQEIIEVNKIIEAHIVYIFYALHKKHQVFLDRTLVEQVFNVCIVFIHRILVHILVEIEYGYVLPD